MDTWAEGLRYEWRVYIEMKQGFNPVSIAFYCSCSYTDAFEYLDTRIHLNTKKRHLFVKQLGNKHRFYFYDERFAAELLARQDVEADEFYDEPTTDDRASVQIHKRGFKPVVWRGLHGARAVPDMKPDAAVDWDYSVIDEKGGLG